MKQLLGITVLLLVLYGIMFAVVPEDSRLTNHLNLAKRVGLYGIITLGAGILIISGGIDLSIGSVVALSATLTAILLTDPDYQWPPALVLPLVLVMGVGIGLINGLLVTKLQLPPFMVTLCGLFIYRGVARTISGNMSKGLGNQFEDLKHLLYDDPVVLFPNLELPRFFVIFLVLAAVATVFLHFSVYGRYLYAIGSNEKAARYSGIATDRYKILAYVICSTLAAFFGILFLMEQNSVRSSADGSFYELYAIAGAVMGGCSLRGGEGTVLGMVIGTAILWLLPNLTNLLGVSSELEFIVIGGALLVGAVLDEVLRPKRVVRVAG
jgi:ribose transport system permease protein